MRLSIAKLRSAGSYLASLALVALVCGPIAGLREVSDVSNSSMLFLLPVLASAVLFGRGQAIFAAVASFFAYDFLFVEPHYTLTVSSGDEYVALGLLLVTGMITGQLAALLRQRALEAEAREKEAVVLYDVVRLMVEPELERALTSVAERLRRELGLAAVLITFEERNTPSVQADVGDIEAIRVAQQASGRAGDDPGLGAGAYRRRARASPAAGSASFLRTPEAPARARRETAPSAFRSTSMGAAPARSCSCGARARRLSRGPTTGC